MQDKEEYFHSGRHRGHKATQTAQTKARIMKEPHENDPNHIVTWNGNPTTTKTNYETNMGYTRIHIPMTCDVRFHHFSPFVPSFLLYL